MYAISTSAFIFILALASSLAVVEVQATGPRGGKPRPVCSHWEKIPDGSTCGGIANQYQIGKNVIEELNPLVNCGTTLTAQSLCIAGRVPDCLKLVDADAKTCDDLLSSPTWDINKTKFYNYNSDVDEKCDDLIIGNAYCVAID